MRTPKEVSSSGKNRFLRGVYCRFEIRDSRIKRKDSFKVRERNLE